MITFRSMSVPTLKAVSGIISIEPLPRYQKVSASYRAFAKAHPFSSADPFVPYTKIIRFRNASLNGPDLWGPLSDGEGASDTAQTPFSRERVIRPADGQGTLPSFCP